MPMQRKYQSQITVIESAFNIQQSVLPVFQVIIQNSKSKVSLVRFPFDFVEFHQKILSYHPKCKISFPTISNPKRHSKRRSFQDLLPFNRKSNSEKIQKYLERCFDHSIISVSSLLRDFTRVQREEDVDLSSQLTCATLIPTNKPADKSTTSLIIKKTTVPSPPPPPPPITSDDFNLIKVLGKGCIGKVLLVRSKKDNHLYALKAIQKQWVIEQKEMVHIRAERDILVCLRDQDFLVQLYHVFQTPSTLFLLLEYHAGGDLATQLSLVSKLTPEKTRFYAAEILQGLDVLHSHEIVYRDLKPENVLIRQDGHIVLTDFGLSKIFTQQDIGEEGIPLTQTFCGTAEYLAPEVLLGESYTFVVDFWSLGTLLFEMLSGITPFWADTHMEMYRRVIEEPLVFSPSFDQDTRNLLGGLLEKDPYERLGWGEDGIEMIKLHPYFDDIDWDLVKNRQLKPPFVPVMKDETDVSHFDTVFTKLPVRISHSSDVQQNLFDSFNFDSSLIEFQKNNKPTLRKRHSASSITHLTDDRVNKKRQMTNLTRELTAAEGSSMRIENLYNKKAKKRQPTTSVTSTLNNSVYSAQTVENHLPSVVEPFYFSS